MLSRSNSNAGERLRRAKSTSSHTTTSSGHHHAANSIDPFIVRQHAEVAAIEAYNRARQYDEHTYQAPRPVPPKLQRRRSQTNGRSQGSHLEDARLGRRRSTLTRGESRTRQPPRIQQPTVSEQSSQATDSAGEERIVVHKRSVIPPSSHTAQPNREYLAVPLSSHMARKSPSVHGNGSPTPRHASMLGHKRSTLQLTPTAEYVDDDGYGGSLAHLSNFGEPSPTVSGLQTKRISITETQTDDEILNLARDRCLQDFQQRKLRERKSFMVPQSVKRRATAFFGRSDTGYDNSLPPFNYADDATLAALPPAPEPLPEIPFAPTMKAEKESRSLSSTLTRRFKKAFRRTTKAPDVMPAQHVEANHYHYATSGDYYFSRPRTDNDPFLTMPLEPPPPPPEILSASLNSRGSEGQSSGSKSRVTSWANSTVAGTTTSRAPVDEHLPPVSEQGALHRSASQHTLRKASSFFGRPVKHKLRKPSRPELKSSEESQGLYSALRDRIKPRERTATPEEPASEEQSMGLRVPSARSTLPSQQQVAVSSVKRYSTPTIRSVTPDPGAHRHSICSPVPEALSPEVAGVASADFATQQRPSPDMTPRTALQRRLATRAPAPTDELLQCRMDKSKNRWQAPLDEFSPQPSKADVVENPYELRPLSRNHPLPPASSDLPHHAKIGAEPANRANLLSPSLYSRGSDGASPRPITPVEHGGMVVTITGREVRSYSISPPKKVESTQRHAQGIGQWRRWLSDEMSSFKSAQDDFNLAQAFLSGQAAQRSRSASRQEDAGMRPASASPIVDARPPSAATSSKRPPSSAGRPRACSRRSSFMNERYPMIETSRNSSDQSVRSRGICSRTGDRSGSSTDQDPIVRPSLESQAQKNVFVRPRIVTGRASIAQMELAARKSPPLTQHPHIEPMMSGALTGEPRPEPMIPTDQSRPPPTAPAVKTSRTRSAFDLRAKYKTNSSGGRLTPIEIRRKPMNDHTNILEDNTIRNISAGPYAAQPLPSIATAATTLTSRRENKENSPPPERPDTAGLPALSSSEWLAAGPNKARKPSIVTVHPAYRNRSASRYSPPKSPKEKEGYLVARNGGGKGSPAQRMASEWLEKRSRESTPAFV